MIEATCHCGAVRLLAPRAPEMVADCNCSICRRLGTLWAYYDPAEVVMETPESALDAYARNDPEAKGDLAFRRCGTCGCVVDWRWAGGGDRMGINARLFEPVVLEGVTIRKVDGAAWRNRPAKQSEENRKNNEEAP